MYINNKEKLYFVSLNSPYSLWFQGVLKLEKIWNIIEKFYLLILILFKLELPPVLLELSL